MQFHDFFSNSDFLGYRYIITRESIRNCTPQPIWKEKYMCLGHVSFDGFFIEALKLYCSTFNLKKKTNINFTKKI